MPEIDLGKVTGERGPQGTRGSLWYTGTGVTGTAAEGTVMPSSGVDDAKVDDIYLNVSTDDIYICVLEGAADTAKWAYKGSIKGNIGPQGPAGPTGAVDENTPMTFEQAAARENINSGEAIKTIFGKVKKWFADLGAAAFCNVVNNGTTTAANTVLDGRMGKTLTDKDNNLQDQVNALNENLKNNSRIIIHKGELAASGRGSFPAHSVAVIYNNNTLADIHISFVIGDYAVGSADDYSIFNYDYLKAACGNKEVYWDPFSSFVQMFNDSVASYPESYIGRTGLLFHIDSLKRVMFARAYDADMKVGGWGTSEEKLYKNIGTHVIVDIYGANLS